MGAVCSTYEGDDRRIDVLVGKPEGKRTLGRSRRRWENNIKVNLQDVEWGNVLDWSGSEQGQAAGNYKGCNEPSSCIECGEFLD